MISYDDDSIDFVERSGNRLRFVVNVAKYGITVTDDHGVDRNFNGMADFHITRQQVEKLKKELDWFLETTCKMCNGLCESEGLCEKCGEDFVVRLLGKADVNKSKQ